MSLSSKIELENLIFSRAALLKTAVYAKEGSLSSPVQDLELQTLIYVYNVHFHMENFKHFCCAADALEAHQNYVSQRVYSSVLTPIYHAKNLNFELALLEEK